MSQLEDECINNSSLGIESRSLMCSTVMSTKSGATMDSPLDNIALKRVFIPLEYSVVT